MKRSPMMNEATLSFFSSYINIPYYSHFRKKDFSFKLDLYLFLLLYWVVFAGEMLVLNLTVLAANQN